MFTARETSIVLAGSLVLVFAGGPSSLTASGSPPAGVEDGETPISGEAWTRASEAALAVTGGGRVTDTEAGDEDSFYEVEVTLDDGREVDVQLDTFFRVVGTSNHAAPVDAGRAAR